MSQLSSLFSKGKQVEDAGKPAAPPAASSAKPAGFKIGGASSNPPAQEPPKQESPKESEPTPPATESKAAPAPTPPPPVSPSVADKQFADETPATLPQKEVPADVGEAVGKFIENLKHLHTLTPEPELATNAISGIMMELKQHPQYIKHVSPSDVRVMIQMMRETMGLAKVTKEKAKAKRKSNVSARVAAVMDELADLDDL